MRAFSGLALLPFFLFGLATASAEGPPNPARAPALTPRLTPALSIDEQKNIASQFVDAEHRRQRQRLRAPSDPATAEARLLRGFPKPRWQKGSAWAVRARLPILPAPAGPQVSEAGSTVERVYTFQVLSLQGDSAWIQVSCAESGEQGEFLIDPSLRLKDFRRTAMGQAPAIGGAEFFPVGLPQPVEEEEAPARGARSAGARLELSAVDSWGRPARLVLQDGQPWPLVVESRAGQSVLLSSGGGP